MANDLQRFLGFPSLVPSIWNDEDFWPTAANTTTGVSISEDEKNIFIEVAVPGIDPKNIDLTVKDNQLWIHGEQKEEEKDKKRKYYRRANSSFSYRIAVPGDIDQNTEPEAKCANGVMTITFNKSPKAQPKKIQVKSA
jgi:HSP20 family protein